MKRSRKTQRGSAVRRVTTISIVLISLLVAAPNAAGVSTAPDGPKAATAKGKKKKKKKRKRSAVAPSAPSSPASPGTAGSGGSSPSGDPVPSDPPPSDPPPDPGCSDDSAEENDSIGSATTLPYPGSYDQLSMFRCPEDSDFFRVTLPPGGYFVVEVDPDDPYDAVLGIYDGGGGQLDTVDAQGRGGGEWVAFSNGDGTLPMTRIVNVTGEPEATGAYLLRGYET